MSIFEKIENWIVRIISILSILFVSIFTNVKFANATITIADIQNATSSFSFHSAIPKTIFKVIENDLVNCCQNGQDLVDYRNRSISIEVVAAKGVTNAVTRSESVLGHIFRDATGHVNPSILTYQNRYINLFESVGNNSANPNLNVLLPAQRTINGIEGFFQTFRNGKQVWVQTLNGKIFDPGVNIIPK